MALLIEITTRQGESLSWFGIMPYFGRRKIYMSGAFTMSAILFIIRILGTKGNVMAVGYTQFALCLVWTFISQLSIGQLDWAIPAEVGSTRLRQTLCLARNAHYITDVVGGVLQPYFMNPTEWNLKDYKGFIWGSKCHGSRKTGAVGESSSYYYEIDVRITRKRYVASPCSPLLHPLRRQRAQISRYAYWND
ncbi:hypothetical protein VE02_08299 [Pseudogymnoascus sp. 03VT05]|nr:hypothetical protein VE02_08299 [Pseudogymnoascus sp. 03VT05]